MGVCADAGVVMFLHGEQDTSDTWVELGTMKDLRSSGYRVVAVDLPGKWAEGCEAVQVAVKRAWPKPHSTHVQQQVIAMQYPETTLATTLSPCIQWRRSRQVQAPALP